MTDSLDWAVLPTALCATCQRLLQPLTGRQVGVETDEHGQSYLTISPGLSVGQAARLAEHRECLIDTVTQMTTEQPFTVEHGSRSTDGIWTWQIVDASIHPYATALAAWDTLLKSAAHQWDPPLRITWAGRAVAYYPVPHPSQW